MIFKLSFVKKLFLFTIIAFPLLILSIAVNAQSKYWVVFKDKSGVSFDPYSYFDSKTIQKRIEKGIPLVQFSDLPVRKDYVERINDISEVGTVSRWLNAVTAELKPDEIELVKSLDFVSYVNPLHLRARVSGDKTLDLDDSQKEVLDKQLNTMGGDLFLKENLNGKGVRIAIFDIGFTAVDTLEMFEEIRKEGRIVKTWDFADNDDNVYHYNTHGTTVLGCIAGIIDDARFGMATGAEFLLARTEVRTEIFQEEENWAAAMEWADKNGADIISSSLGYTKDRYFPRDMDGKTVFITRIANLAASKGILVINAAGNEGDEDWQVIGAPADADSVLSVGGINPANGIHISFSSFGPTYDGRLKPNVCSFGKVVSAGKSSVKTAFGTSFSTPLITGFAACVMQLHPEWDNMKVFEEIQNSGHLFPYYDYAHGYGVPQASYFLGENQEALKSLKFIKNVDDLEIRLILRGKEINILGYEDQQVGMGLDGQYLYYHIANRKSGKIRKYAVVLMSDADRFMIPLSEIKKDELVRAYYRGYTETFEIE